MDGQCVPEDRKCFIVHDGRICEWLQTCVLPLDRKLLMLVGNGKGLADDPLLKRICRKCGESMTIRNNRQIYCAVCSKENRLVKERERKRRAREKKRGSINSEVDNSEDIRKKCKMEGLRIGRDDPQHVKVNPECGYDIKTKEYEI